ncbi:DUF6482 family protein [Alteromonas lipolytica]|uniref:NADH-quinone reductase n=1 Tax=Alteromonas lipolytica TaxID=1856405 RepID=A0A1E8FBS7_9ALTE|nr:DUF6482 family protein [Alteromonas lipolytica]OFI32953.1 NADH-quinone reductase [Alteromonas lipolytica]GGF63938.1 hypothetical protein GCM10011338_15360 [Alteromonas lipolytica]
MYKFLSSEIENTPLDIENLEVQSFEMNVYLVQLTIDGKTGLVYNAKDQPMRFFSAGHIREFFAHCKVGNSFMTHDTPYDEMIGNPPKAGHSMALPFSMDLPY